MKSFRYAALSTLIGNAFITLALSSASAVRAEAKPFLAGADVSAVGSLEKAGAVYRDQGRPADPLELMHAHGCNLFRVRLFVNPDPDFMATGGATQDLPAVIALAKRIRATGAAFLLDFHYSDNWADPGHQPTPAAWAALSPAAMEQKVHDYTLDCLKACAAADVLPTDVQIGNELTAGILWPTGQLYKSTGDAEAHQWQEFARLLNAGCRAVREESAATGKPIRIIIHSHGGGRAVPVWFFSKLSETPVDFDVIGLSFYPAWGDSLPMLKSNLSKLIATYHKDVLLCETSYPWTEMPGIHEEAMIWPLTPAGQKQFLQDLTQVLQAQPDGHGQGYVWWYPEAVPVQGLQIWRDGAEGWFDRQGNLLPVAMSLRPEAR